MIVMDKEELLKDLNPQQREAVEINEGSLLVFAGAGSGKTRVITTKIAYAITQLGLKPSEILAVTFTNKACREMQERVQKYVGEELASHTVIRTFHSFGVWLLRRYGDRVGLSRDFTIYDDKESASLLAQCFPNDQKKDIERAAKKIATLKDKMSRPAKYDEKLSAYFDAYQQKLKQTGNVDFADMILKSIELLKDNADIKNLIHNRFRMILVDEYQDSNTAQYILLQHLVGPDTFVCVVGDDDQSIYRFRGAQVENILNFPKVFPNTKTVVLGKNYRCSQAILEVAKDVIKNNQSRAQKDLNASNAGGIKPKLYYVNSEFDEAQQIVNIIKRNPASENNTTAIVYRTNAQSKAFEDRFIMNNIAYHIVGSLKFYDREEIRDCIAMISLFSNPRDSVAFQRMINKPARGIGEVTVTKIISEGGDCIQTSLDMINRGDIKGKAADSIRQFIADYNNIRQQIGKLDNSSLLNLILERFNIKSYYTKRDEEEHSSDSSRVENLNQMVNMLTADDFATGIEGFHTFLEYVALDPSSLDQSEGDSQTGVTLITMHNTKGLEFDRVFAVGMEDEIFPSLREDATKDDLEEERRICYVAMTRAKHELYLFCAKSRMVWGHISYENPSRFLKEINPSHVEKIDLRTNEEQRSSYGSFFKSYSSYDNAYSYKYKKNSGYINTSKYDDFDDWQPSKPKATLIKKPKPEVGKPVIDWKINDRVRSAILGDGTVTSIKMFGNREVLVVNFDNGKMGTFVKDKADFEKI